MTERTYWFQLVDALTLSLSDIPAHAHDFAIANMTGDLTKLVTRQLPSCNQLEVAGHVSTLLLATKQRLKSIHAGTRGAPS